MKKNIKRFFVVLIAISLVSFVSFTMFSCSKGTTVEVELERI